MPCGANINDITCLTFHFSDILKDMHLVRLPDAAPYTPAQHTGVKAYRLQGGEGSGEGSAGPFCSVGISYYEPDGRADMAAGPQEKIYVILSGEISITTAPGVTAPGRTTVMRPFDSCVIAAGEAREVRNANGSEAVLLVITPRKTPDTAKA